MPRINTEVFSYCDGTFAAQLSDLNNFLPACFDLVSQRTGDTVAMTMIQRHSDGEGDITHWEFKPRDPSEARFKNLVIFND